MEVTRKIAEEQSQLWNGPAGQAWVEAQELLDRMFEPFEERLVAEIAGLAVLGARRVLDVGCGTGATTLALSRSLGEEGSATGIDISEPMIGLARERARNSRSHARFMVADAGTYPLDEGAFDAVVSRFGVMFFADPPAAFANLRRAARNGFLRCIVFRSPEENPFMTAAERAAAPLLENLPQRRADGPGQFAMADPARTRHILEQGGWREVDITPIDVACSFPKTGLQAYLTRLGPLGLALRNSDEATRERVTRAVLGAFDPYVDGDEVRFTAACWMLRSS